MTVSPRERISCNSFGAAGRTRTCIAPIKSRALCLLSYDGTRYFPIREPRMRLCLCSAVVIVIASSIILELALGIEPRVSALRVRRFGLLS